MIKLKNLINRVYDNRICVRFEYDVYDSDGSENPPYCFTARYWRDNDDFRVWTMQVVIPGDGGADSQVYNIHYCLPKEDMNLDLIAAIGLKYFQMKIKEEVQKKSNWDFAIGSLIKDM